MTTRNTRVNIEKKAGYAKNRLIHMMYRNGNVNVECIRNYAKALGVMPQTLMEGMFDDGVERTDR